MTNPYLGPGYQAAPGTPQPPLGAPQGQPGNYSPSPAPGGYGSAPMPPPGYGVTPPGYPQRPANSGKGKKLIGVAISAIVVIGLVIVGIINWGTGPGAAKAGIVSA